MDILLYQLGHASEFYSKLSGLQTPNWNWLNYRKITNDWKWGRDSQLFLYVLYLFYGYWQGTNNFIYVVCGSINGKYKCERLSGEGYSLCNEAKCNVYNEVMM